MARALFTGNTSCKHSQNIPSLLHIPHDFLATHHPYQYPTHNGRPLCSFELVFGNNSSCVCNGTTAKLTLHLIIFPSQLIKRSQCFCILQFLFHLFLNVVYGRVQKSLKCSTFFSLYAKSKKSAHIFRYPQLLCLGLKCSFLCSQSTVSNFLGMQCCSHDDDDATVYDK